MRANQLRLWFAEMAYLLICASRRIGLKHTPDSPAPRGTIRLKLLKIGALVRTSVRRIELASSSAFPLRVEYHNRDPCQPLFRPSRRHGLKIKAGIRISGSG